MGALSTGCSSDRFDHFVGRCTRSEDRGNAGRFEIGHVLRWHDPSHDDRDIASARPQRFHDERGQGHVSSRQHRETDHIDVFVDGRGRNCVGSLEQTGVDHFETGIAQQTSNDLHTAVVSIEAHLGHEYACCRHEVLPFLDRRYFDVTAEHSGHGVHHFADGGIGT